MEKYLCIIQVRMDSVRLPGKALFKVGRFTILEYLIKRVRLSKKIDKIIVATSESRSDDKIVKLCETMKIECFRGSEENVLERYYQCAINNPEYAYIIRLTADNPLVDPAVIDEVIDFSKNHPEYDFVYNGLIKTFPIGLDVEIFKRSALIESAVKSRLAFEKEHVDEYVLRRPKFKKGNLSAPYNWSHFRLTMDYQEDFEVIKFLIKNCKITDGYLRYISVLTKHPVIMFKNTRIKNNKGRFKEAIDKNKV